MNFTHMPLVFCCLAAEAVEFTVSFTSEAKATMILPEIHCKNRGKLESIAPETRT
jgi:hypothetical protein